MKRSLIVLLLFTWFGDAIFAEADNMQMYGLILAGGFGQRLWPLSRENYPKQFLTVGSSKNLLEQSINRFEGLVNPDNIWIVTAEKYASRITSFLTHPIKRMIIEPDMRNTGPAILYSCFKLYEKNPNAVVLFVPADSYIPEKDYAVFRSFLHKAAFFAAEHDQIVLFGVQPTYPAVGYGYIEYEKKRGCDGIFPVERFHEKPSLAVAKNYIQQKNMLWNTCIFVAQVKTFINEFASVAPDLYAEVRAFCNGEKLYEEITSISVDYAVMERSSRVWVLPVDFSWRDVGTIDVFLSIKSQTVGLPQNVINIDAHNNAVEVPDKLVAFVGVNDLCVVETPDALLITKRSEVEKVRAVVAHLKKENKTEYL